MLGGNPLAGIKLADEAALGSASVFRKRTVRCPSKKMPLRKILASRGKSKVVSDII